MDHRQPWLRTLQAARRGLALGIGACLLNGACASADPGVFVADARVCAPPNAVQRAWLDGAAWSPFSRSIRVCKVGQNHASTALLLISVWADDYLAEQADGSTAPPMPAPLLVSPDGRRLGELPMNFPTDPPAELRIQFANWNGGLPQLIRLCVVSPTAADQQWLPPLAFDPAVQRYRPTDPNATPSATGACHAK